MSIRLFLLCFFFLWGGFFVSVYAIADTLFVKQPQVPILIERQDNVLFYLKLHSGQFSTLDEIVIRFSEKTDLSAIRKVKLYYGGTDAVQAVGKKRFAPVDYIPSNVPGKTLAANTSYSVLKAVVEEPKQEVVLRGMQRLFPGINYFWISVQMDTQASLCTKISSEVVSAMADGKSVPVQLDSEPGMERRMGIGVRHAGDDGAVAYRIPGLVTSKKGTLLGVYDIRYNNRNDLQEHIEIGLSRSIDGGKSWERMRIPLAFGETGGLPAAQNGVGDPSILVDEKTNTIWIAALWAHGMGNQRTWFSSQQGMEEYETGQLMLTRSDDDGKTWSDPINITGQVKDPSWSLLLQGPGRGITMDNGTLVFPIQFKDSARIPNAGIMYSKDRGKTWKIHNLARTNTTEAQVVEVEPNVLMLNMRDNRGGSRAVATSNDLGKTWVEHSSSRKALQEPVCMASLIKVKAEENVLGKDILLFSNPNTTKGRHHLTIKASLDGGLTWLPQHQLLLDEDNNWGYSCLTMIDKETIGILYESSVAHMTFQAVKLLDIIKEE